MESVTANFTPKSCVDQSDEIKYQFVLSKVFNHDIINALKLCFRGCIVNIIVAVTPIITRRFNDLKK